MKNLVILLTALFITFSCTQQKANQIAKVPYTEAKNYFVKNTYKTNAVTSKKITSQQEFDEIFGMATTMGKDGKPTSIDFSKDYVIALIGVETNKSTDFLIKNLVREKNSIILSYAIKEEGTENSYSILPTKILIVSKQYDGNIISNKL
ncbi:hypothetical protein [Chryseobacterium rhizosphaerae]|uniref:hypothetical protein n=1 Tax=Chryseobacterium rhizosphaerae TaxID=395937 RepID=UPI0023599AB8|nr:hypothetical protein [Chryseobacterium rhizosphaerae]MDC8102253.1 hypothetical protein [Chryseobacterium rhizosphaerae]